MSGRVRSCQVVSGVSCVECQLVPWSLNDASRRFPLYLVKPGAALADVRVRLWLVCLVWVGIVCAWLPLALVGPSRRVAGQR